MLNKDIKLCLITGDEIIMKDKTYQELFDFMILKPIDIK